MNATNTDSKTDTQKQPYSKPQLTAFGAVRNLTAAGSKKGAEQGQDNMIMV